MSIVVIDVVDIVRAVVVVVVVCCYHGMFCSGDEWCDGCVC